MDSGRLKVRYMNGTFLSQEGLAVYEQVKGRLGKLSGREEQTDEMDAMLFAIHADVMAEKLAKVRNERYTAEDYVRESFHLAVKVRDEDDEYFEAIEKGDMEKVAQMVEDKARENGFLDAIPEQTKAYKLRNHAAPQKTMKVYKVFTMAPDGAPTALFVGGTEKLPQGVWLDAVDTFHFTSDNGREYIPSTQNPYSKARKDKGSLAGKTGKSVPISSPELRRELVERGYLKKGSTAKEVTALAYRPGWHAGNLPFFPQGGNKVEGYSKKTEDGLRPEMLRDGQESSVPYEHEHKYNQVVFECEVVADKDYTEIARAQEKAKNKDGSLHYQEADLQYTPEEGFYYYATNPLTQNNPNFGAWVISGSLKINRALTQEECDEILHENGLAAQRWEGGRLDLTSLGYEGEELDTARKTLAPITYDENGEIIPLSKRFDANNDNVLYQAAAIKHENTGNKRTPTPTGRPVPSRKSDPPAVNLAGTRELANLYTYVDEILEIMDGLSTRDKAIIETSNAWNALADLYDHTNPNEWREKFNEEVFPMMKVPLVLQLVGAEYKDLNVYGSFFYHALRDLHPGMNMDIVKQLPISMTDPLMIIKGNTDNSYVFVLETFIETSAKVVVPVEIGKKDDTRGVLNVVNSAYARTKSKSNPMPRYSWFIRNIQEGKLAYLDRKRSFAWAKDIRKSAPVNGNAASSETVADKTTAGIIMDENTKTASNKDLLTALYDFSVTEAGQKVKDENDLDELRKARPELYQTAWHGAAVGFNRFNAEYVGSGQGAQTHGWGLYFSKKKEVAKGYSEALSINIPIITLEGHNYVYDATHDTFLDTTKGNWNPVKKNSSKDYTLEVIQEAFCKDPDNKLMGPAEVERCLDERAKIFKHMLLRSKTKGDAKNCESWLGRIERVRKWVRNKEWSVGRAGTIYKANIPDDSVLLDEQRKLGKQPATVQEGLQKLLQPERYVHKLIEGIKATGNAEALEMIKEHEEDLKMLHPYRHMKQLTDDVINTGNEEAIELMGELWVEYMRYREGEDWADNTDFLANDVEALTDLEIDIQGVFENDMESPFNKPLEEMTGGEVYEYLEREWMTGLVADGEEGKAVSLAMNEVGIKGITYDGRIDGKCYVIFDDKAVRIMDKAQEDKEQLLGSFKENQAGVRVVSLFEGANESTFVHEMGHLFMSDLERMAQADEESREDLRTVNAWAAWHEGAAKEYVGTPWEEEFKEREDRILAAQAKGDMAAVVLEKDTWAQERFARGFEVYVAEGKAPTSGVGKVFKRFKEWMGKIYEGFKLTGGKASPEVEQVMGKMLTSDRVQLMKKIEKGVKEKDKKILKKCPSEVVACLMGAEARKKAGMVLKKGLNEMLKAGKLSEFETACRKLLDGGIVKKNYNNARNSK